ncbi:MAG: choice-of-anchor V domain-containing protein [Bacteroidota bacterium]
MKKNYSPRTLQIAGLLLGSLLWLANNSNPPNGNTGAPFDSTCASSGCHGTSNVNGYGGTVTVDGLPSTVSANTVYPLTITVTATAGSPIKAGFQLVSVSSANNQNAGDLATVNTETGTETFGGREYIEHRNGKVFSGGVVSWNFNWTSPASITGTNITFYYIANFCNNNNSSSGDFPLSGSLTVGFNGPPPLSATITDQTNVTCNGGNNGSATVTGSGGLTPYTYHWSNNQTTQTAINLAAGSYTVTVTGASNSGTATAVATITAPPAITLTSPPGGTISCINQSVNVTATAGGGTPPFTYAWSNGQTGNTATYTATGPYTVTTTDNAGCTKSATGTITGNTTPPNAVASTNGSLSCTNTSTTLSCTGSSTGANISLLWTTTNGNIVSGQTTCNPTVNVAGVYTLRVTNTINGCTATATTTVTSSATPPGASATGATITCSSPSVTISASSPTPNVTYSWSGPGGFTSGIQSPSVNTAGTYTVTVTNPANSCTSTASAIVTSNTVAPPSSATAGNVLTCATTTSQVFGNSGVTGATYHWTGPNSFVSNLQNPTVNAPGAYLLTVTNPANGCTSTATATVQQDISTPNASASAGPTLTCTVLSTTISANSTTPGVTYAWSGPGGFISQLQSPSVTVPGTFTVTITGANGCTSTASATVQQNIVPPGATASGGVINCTNASVTLNSSSTGNMPSYAWNGPGGTSSAQNFTVNVAGAYNLVVTDGVNGCTSTASATVSSNLTAPTAAAAAPNNLNCNNSSVQINGSGSSQGTTFTYSWTTANGNIVSGGNTLTPTVSAAGTYTILVTNTDNGCTNTASATVSQTPPPTASVSNTINVFCNGGTNGATTVTANGGTGVYTYVWSNGATTSTISNLSAGVYIATVTDGDNCTVTATATITQPTSLVVTVSATGETALGANDGTATAAPAGGTPGYAYHWSNNATTATITGLMPGTYTVTTTDANGCTSVQTATVNSFNCNVSATTTTTNVICNGANNGTATVSLNGAINPVQYAWSNGGTTATIQNLAPGTYTVQILDGAGCPLTRSVSISEPTALAANASATNETSIGGNNGTATATPTGGTAPYTYLWSNGATTASIQNLAPGAYTVTTTDSNNCTAVQAVTVNAFNCAVTADISGANVSCYSGTNGQATIVFNGGTLPNTYLWNNGATTATITGLAAGVYTATATDAAGCSATRTVTVTEPTAIAAGAQTTNVPCPESQTGSAIVSVTGGTAPYQISWPGGSNGQNLGVGNYAVSIVDNNACTLTLNVPILSTDTQAPAISCPGNISICGADAVNYDLPTISDNCSVAGITPKLLSGLPSGAAFNDGVTTQVYQATDASGNTATCSFNVTVNPLPDVLVNSTTNDIGNSGVGSIDITPVGNNGPYVFIWKRNGVFFSNSEDLSGLTAGAYTLSMTDVNGCGVAVAPIVITNTVGTSAPAANVSIRVIPNPAVASIRIEIEGFEPVSAQIFDLRGNLVQELNATDIQTSVPVQELPTGMYYLRLLTEAGQWKVVKFVKSGF